MTPPPEVHELFSDACPVVPLLVLHREGELAKETCAVLERFITDPWKFATRVGTLDHAQQFFEETRQLPPLKLTRIPTLPTWCVWLLEIREETVASIESQISALTDETQVDGMAHLVFLHTTTKISAEQSGKLQEELAKLRGFTRGFVLMTKEDSPTGRTAAVAMGLAAYLYASWRRFCSNGGHDTSSLDDALLLDSSGESQALLHTLGLGIFGLDEAYHGERIARVLHEELVDKWLDPHCGAVPSLVYPPNEQLLSNLLPQPEFPVSVGEDSSPGTEIILGKEIHTLHCHLPLPPAPMRKHFSSRQHLMLELHKLCTHHFVSQVNHLPQAERVISMRCKDLRQRLREPVDQHLDDFAETPRGFVQGLKERLDECRDHVASFVNSSVRSPEHHQPFAAIRNLRDWITQLPNLTGGLARYAVLLATLTALVLHSRLPDIISVLWDADIPRYYTLAFVVAIVLLGAWIIWIYVDRVHRIFKALDLLRQAIHANLLLKLGKLLCSKLRVSAGPLLEEIVIWTDKLEIVRLKLRKAMVFGEMPQNTHTEFGDVVSNNLLIELQSALVQRLHEEWVRKHDDFSTLILYPESDWPTELLALARTLSAETLQSLPFDELARHTGWNSSQKQRCLESMMDASRRPTLPVGAALMPRCLCVVSQEWSGLGGGHRQIEFFDLPVPVLLAVSPIPVPSV